ncbi:MAG: hypothetical protein JSV51_10080, partial [Candidatus Bathyarchaeota archaeon]
MRKFADIHLHPDLTKKEDIEKIIYKAAELNYAIVGISLPLKTRQSTINFSRRICEAAGVDFVARIDLTPKSTSGLLKNLRQVRRGFELVSVNCLSKSVARQAAKDHRVDLLAFPSINPRERFFDISEARLASQGVAALEIDMSLILQLHYFPRVRILSSLRREVAIAAKFHIPVVISSNAVDSYQLREPRELASLTTLFGMDKESALNA